MGSPRTPTSLGLSARSFVQRVLSAPVMITLYGELLDDVLVVSSTVTELYQVDPDRLR
jgi:hypothetical protein